MKKIFSFVMVAACLVAMFSSCTKEVTVAKAVLTLNPSTQIALSEDTSSQVAVTASWEAVSPTASYTLFVAPVNGKKGVHYTIPAGSATSVKITGEELQKALYYCGFEQGASTTVEFFVEAQDGSAFSQSEVASVRVILYTHVVVLNTPVLTLSSTDVKLDLNNASSKAIDISWTDASAEGAVVEYTLYVGLQGQEDPALNYPMEDALSFSMTTQELQDALMAAGFAYGAEANLYVYVAAEATDGTIEPVESEAVNFKVTLSKKPRNPNIPGSVCLVGDATGAGWDNKAADFQFACQDEEMGIFYLRTEILNQKTFKFLADGSWNKGFNHNEDIDKYWDIVYKNGDLGDNDYFRLLVAGIYDFTINSDELTIDVKLVEAKTTKIYVLGTGCDAGWNFSDDCVLNLTDAAKGIYSADLNLTPADIQLLPLKNNWNYGWFEKETVTLSSTPAKVYEQRENGQYPAFFTVADAGTYRVVLDTQNLTISATQL